jgi:hypothetical protein
VTYSTYRAQASLRPIYTTVRPVTTIRPVTPVRPVYTKAGAGMRFRR